MSDDRDNGQAADPPPVASIAAHRATRRRARPARAPEIPPQPDGSDILRRLEHATAGDEVIARLGEIMARVTDDPATAAFWASLTRSTPTAGPE